LATLRTARVIVREISPETVREHRELGPAGPLPALFSAAMHPIDGGFRFVPPTPRRSLVPRERLVAALRERFSRRVVVVVAPAGFGKTTLLSQALAGVPPTLDATDIWFGCTSDDEAAPTLAEGLCRAVGIDVQP
jgi:hypothetical protein